VRFLSAGIDKPKEGHGQQDSYSQAEIPPMMMGHLFASCEGAVWNQLAGCKALSDKSDEDITC
jgi:hypothetical protein